MPTRVDPFTGRPLEDRNREEPDIYEPLADEPEDEDMHITGEEKPSGFIHPHERQRGARFRASVEIPAIMVGLVTAVLVGVFAVVLAVQGTLTEAPGVLQPALVIGGSVAAICGTLAALYLWPPWARQGPVRTMTWGVLAAAAVFGVLMLGLGFLVR